MTDYSRYNEANDEWLAVLASAPPLDAPPLTRPVERRDFFNKFFEENSAKAMADLASKVVIGNYSFTSRDGAPLQARSYRPVTAGNERLPVFYYIHGGGFLTGSLVVDDPTCSNFSLDANVVVVHVNYRHTPEHTYPTQWNDSEDGFLWMHSQMDTIQGIPESVVVGGISAGAQLAASLVIQAHLGNIGSGVPSIAGQVLMVPVLAHPVTRSEQLTKNGKASASSYESNKNADILPLAELYALVDLLKIPSPGLDDLRMNTMYAKSSQIKGLPPTTIAVSGLDILRDEGLEYGKLLSEAGVPTQVYIFKGMPHFFRGFGDKLSQSQKWDKIIETGIKWPLSQPEGTGSFIIREV